MREWEESFDSKLTMDEEKPVFVRARVSQKLRAKFKAACALEGKGINDVLNELIEKWLKEHERPSGK